MADKILVNFLNEIANKAKEEIQKTKILTEKDVIAIITQSHNDDITYIKENMVTKKEFSEFKEEVKKMGESFNKAIESATTKHLTFYTITIAIIGIIIALKK
jgi:hypothetical protein